MPQHDIRVAKGGDETSKRRPSIELSPSLEKPVYIITRNLNGPHILHLVEELEKNHILYQMQQETNTLGFSLNQRFFVIVDNRYGEVTLGPEFGSILMTIVGYPRVGKNKKNRYYEKPAEIIKFFEEFKKNQDISKQTASLIQQQCSDLILEIPGTPSALKNRIEVKSICKYSKAPLTTTQTLTPKKDDLPVKLIVFIDKQDKQYLKICENILIRAAQSLVQEAFGMDQVRKKTMFHTDKVKIFYLVNEANSKELIKTIFLGEVIIYSTRSNKAILHRIVDEPKIYGVAYEDNELLKIFDKIGIKTSSQRNISNLKPPTKKNSQERIQKNEIQKKQQRILQKDSPPQDALQVNLVTNEQKDNNSLLKNESNIRDKQLEISKAQNNCSLVSQPNPHQVSDLNTSIISQASSGSRKIKRLKGIKDKQKAVIKDQQSLSKDKQVILEKQNKQDILKQQNSQNRKKTLRKQEGISTSKSKKNLTFKENLVINSEVDKRKLIKSIPKVMPEEILVETVNKSTYTQSEYYATVIPLKENRASFNSGLKPAIYQNQSLISSNHALHGIFYRQFIPKLKKTAILLAEQVQSNILGLVPCYSFLYMHEYDRHVRRLKNKMKQKGIDSQFYNFVVIIPEEEVQSFLTYCKEKNSGYDREEELDCKQDFNSSNFSQMNPYQFKIHVFLLIDGNNQGSSEIIDFNRIKVHKSRLGGEENELILQTNLIKGLQNGGLNMGVDHLHS